MIYSQPEYLILLIAVAAICPLLRSYYARLWFLIAASLVYYAWAGLFDSLIFLAVVVSSWAAVALAKRYPRKRKIFLASGILLMLLHLSFWKYAFWGKNNVQYFFPGFLKSWDLAFPLPVGISFFTLQGVAYLTDYMRGSAKFMSFPKYFLFKSFFPQLVAGPIVRSSQLLPQLETLRGPRAMEFFEGVNLFIMGFFKKTQLADRVGPFVDRVFAEPGQFNRVVLLQALLGYTVQIWADFSGYTDMGRGSAKMLGITLPENFLSPYFSRCPSEFWKRWHITLSEWIRDYLYIPLGGSRGSLPRIIGVAVVTMAISGLWHGAAWTFVIWGLYHGALLAGERLLIGSRVQSTMHSLLPGALYSVALGVLMFGLTSAGWLVFRSEGLGKLVEFMKGVGLNSGPATSAGGGDEVLWCALICFTLQAALYYSFERQEFVLSGVVRGLRTATARSPRLAGALAGITAAIALTAIILLRKSDSSAAFIYFRF
jgi:alginate O-acetyltransferase complex protein AlgI